MERLEFFPVPFVKHALKKWELARVGSVPENEIREYYEAHQEEFTTKERVIASHILLRSRETAEAILAELKAGADLTALAHERSADLGTRDEGGRLPPFSRGQLTPELEQAAFGLEPGERSGVVEDKAGFHIL
jgi:foldase protein PrsA